MTSKIQSNTHVILAIALMFTITVTGLTIKVNPALQTAGVEGQFMAAASGMETDTVHKEVGEYVHVKARVKNIGSVSATYLIIAKYRAEGTDDWVQCGLEDLRLEPETYETMLVGIVQCTDEMAGMYFDLLLVLYDAGSERVLDERVMERAWFVNENVPEGTIHELWVE
jgi:hypothetical protein